MPRCWRRSRRRTDFRFFYYIYFFLISCALTKNVDTSLWDGLWVISKPSRFTYSRFRGCTTCSNWPS
jgi:hypothetical protein